jgi:hypothetical protein
MFDGIQLVGKIENKDTKVAEHDLMDQALTEYMAKQTRLQARRELEAIADGEPLPKPSHFTKELRKLAAERGMKI